MLYNIYKHVDDERFTELKARLQEIEILSDLMMMAAHFSKGVKDYNDVLAVDYVYSDGNIMGNIGFTYDDESEKRGGNELFRYYMLKAKDEGDRRFFRRLNLPDRFTIQEIEEGFLEVLSGLVERFFGLGNDELTEWRERRGSR